MGLLGLFVIMLLILWELAVFRKWNRDAFDRAFYFERKKGVLTSALLVFFVLHPDRDLFMVVFVLMVAVPLYIIRRERYLNRADAKRCDISKKALISDGIGITLMWLYCAVVTTLAARVCLLGAPVHVAELGELLISAVVSSVMLLVLIYRASGKFSQEGFLTNLALRKFNNSNARIIVFPVLLGIAFASAAGFLMLQRIVQPHTPLNDVLDNVTSTHLLGLFLFLGLVIAPFAEEVTFRGYFYHVVRAVVGSRAAFVIIALTFGGLHIGQYWGDWLAIGMVGLLGFVLTGLRVWTGSTVASVVMHYTYNIGVTIIPVIMLMVSNPSYFEYQAYFDRHDVATKEALLVKALERNPELVTAYNDLAWLYAEEGIHLENALELIEEALSYDGENEAYLDTKAAILEKLKRFDDADK